MQGESGRIAYNATLQKTNNEQMLLNLVRLRYVEYPFFLEVSNVTTQFTASSRVAPIIPFPGFNSSNPGVLGGEVFWQNQPTISYTPLEGQGFARQLLHPIDLVALQNLIYAGWDVDRVFRICVQSINTILNAPTAAGPTMEGSPQFENFMKLTELLDFFQSMGTLQIGVKSQKGCDCDKYAMQLCFPSGYEQSKELIKILGPSDHTKKYHVYDIPLGFEKENEMGIMPRSLLGCMYYLSVGVQLPSAHKLANYVWTPEKEGMQEDHWSKLTRGLLTVKNSKSRPKESYVCVQHKGYWFYIDDSDIESKRTFVLLLQLYNLQSTTVQQEAPILTLPLG